MKKSLCIFISLLLTFFLFTSCKVSYDEPVREYFEYWSQTVATDSCVVASDYTVINGLSNLEARDPIQLVFYVRNPQQYNLDLYSDSQPNFSILNSEGNDVASDKTISLSSDRTEISLTASLSDSTEKQTLRVSGMYGVLKGEDNVATSSSSYSFSFRQNSSPDIPTNVRNPSAAENDGYHLLHFYYPDQSLLRNQDLSYKVYCYLYEDGLYTLIDSKTLTSDDSLSNSEFAYYFDSQEASLRYDYVVYSCNPDGLKSDVVSTSPTLGVCYVTEPEFTFGSNGEFTGNTAENNSVSYDVIEYTDSSLSLTVTNTSEDSEMVVKINGSQVSETTILSDGFNAISVTISKNLCRPITIEKNVYVVKKLTEPEFVYGDSGSENGYTATKDGESFTVIEYTGSLDLSVTNTYSSDASTMTVDINGTSQSGDSQTWNLVSGEDGYFTVTATLTKEYCNTLTVTKRYYLVLKLTEPVISFPNKTSETDSEVYYSLLTDESITMSVENTYTGDNSTLVTNIDGDESEGDLSEIALSDGLHVVTVTLSKDYCTPVTLSKNFTVYYKPVKFEITKGQLYCNFGDSGDTNEICGTLYINSNNANTHTLRFFDEADFGQYYWDAFGYNAWSATLSSKSDYIRYYSDNMYEDDTTGDDDIGEVNVTVEMESFATIYRSSAGSTNAMTINGYPVTLIRDSGSTVILEVHNTSGESLYHQIYFTLSD